MKNGQLKLIYNIQIGVEGEYIVGVYISNERYDQLTLIPLLDKLENKSNKVKLYMIIIIYNFLYPKIKYLEINTWKIWIKFIIKINHMKWDFLNSIWYSSLINKKTTAMQ